LLNLSLTTTWTAGFERGWEEWPSGAKSSRNFKFFQEGGRGAQPMGAGRGLARWVTGRPFAMVLRTFIVTNLAGDPGHPLSMAQKFLKYFFGVFTHCRGIVKGRNFMVKTDNHLPFSRPNDWLYCAHFS
jgi:hypothetical protein